MRQAKIVISGAALLALAGCATNTAGQAQVERVCFDATGVSNYAVVDSTTVNLRAGGETFQIKLLGVCPDIRWSQAVALSTAGSSRVCTGLDLTISAMTSAGPQECAADSIRRLTAEEVSALAPGQRP